jgi:SAM-dependent methyltransferase
MKNPLFQYLSKALRSVLLRGDNNHCPICRGDFVTFLPYGVRKRPNAQCPSCGSLERQRMIWLFAEQRGLFKSRQRLLHVSPEKILFKKFSLDANIDYVPIDKFDPGYRYPKGTENVDITAMPYADDSFNAILCIHVLEHVPDDHLAMTELRRVLKPGGWAIIQVPLDKKRASTYEDFSITDPAEREKAFGQPDHLRWYGRDYAERLRRAGFEVEVVDFAGEMPEKDQNRYGLPLDDDIYLCRKKG